jgi:hypothetical protein
MTEGEITALLDRLVERFEDEAGDWDAVLDEAAAPVRVAPKRRRRLHSLLPSRGRGLLLFAATAAVTALVLLAATAPWSGGPSVLERAAAAIALPRSGEILHESITIRVTPAFEGIPRADRVHYLEAAACMRRHGLPNFPDPVFQNGNVEFDIPPGIDMSSPTVRPAISTCQKLIPAGLPYSVTDHSRNGPFTYPLPRGFLYPPYTLGAHIDVWMAGKPSHRFRLTEDASLSGRLHGHPKTVGLRSTEFGSTVGAVQGLAYDAATRTLDPITFASPLKSSQLDVTEFIWQAITSGRAKVDGRAVIDGRPVVRIRILVHGYGRVVSRVFYYVDATTYRPVRVEMTNNAPLFLQSSPGFPLLTLTLVQASSLPVTLGRFVLDFDTYRYLTPNAANDRLTNIQATHPRAKIV